MGLFSLPYYNQMNIAVRKRELWENGDHIDTVKYLDQRILLYAYDNFVVQVWYNEKCNSIIDVRGIPFIEAAEKYVSLTQCDLT